MATSEGPAVPSDEELRGALARALTDPHTYGESVQHLGREIAGCHICVAGSASEGDTQDAIERHRAHRARADALTREASPPTSG